MDLDQKKIEILSRLDIQMECETLGVRFAGRPNSAGWIPCHNPYKKDEHPSCGICAGNGPARGYLMMFNVNGGNRAAISFWDLVRDFGNLGTEFKDIIQYYAHRTGVRLGRKKEPPTEEMLTRFKEGLNDKLKAELQAKRGFSDTTVKKYEIGYCIDRNRYTFPVYDAKSNLVNIRFYHPTEKPKMLNLTGYGKARLWNVNQLTQAESPTTVCITEGEFDAMLLEQETELVCVSPTNGCNAFLTEWAEAFKGHHVVFIWDCDREGRDALKTILPLLKNVAASVKIIWLFEEGDKNRKDFTDFITKAGGTGEQLLTLIENNPAYEFPEDDKTPVDPETFFESGKLIQYKLKTHILQKYDLFHDGSGFYQYLSTGVWKQMPDDIISQLISNALGYKEKRSYISDTLKLAQWAVTRLPTDTKQPYPLINLANGMLNLETLDLLPHNKSYMSTVQVPIKYDPEAECPRWMQFLQEIFPDDPSKADTLKDFAGYCFIPEIFIDKCLFLIGSGANGKSVFINTLIKIIGEENTSNLELTQLPDKFQIGRLKDKLLNVSSEVSNRVEIQSGIFKQVVSGEWIEADRKFKEPFSFRPFAKHIFAMNEPPILPDRTYAIERRVTVINFRERFNGKREDKHLEAKLEKELSGIFNWVLEGLLKVKKTSEIRESDNIEQERKRFMEDLNPVLNFVTERCELKPSIMTGKADLYKSYKEFCKDEAGVKPLSRMKFFRQLLNDFPWLEEIRPYSSGSRVRYISGIDLLIEERVIP